MRLSTQIARRLLALTERIETTLRRFDSANAASLASTDRRSLPYSAAERDSLKMTEQALATEQYLVRTLMDNLPDAIYFKDTESRFLRVNPAHARRFGVSDPAALVGKSDHDFSSQERALSTLRAEQEIIRTGQPIIDLQEKVTWPDQTSSWMSTTKMPFRNEAGQIVGTFGISRDITGHRHAEEALKASEERYRVLCELLWDYAYSFRVNPDGSFEDEWVTGDSFIRVTGYRWDELDALGPFTLFHPDVDRASLEHDQEMLRQGLPVTGDYRIVTKWGEERCLLITRRPQWDEKHERVLRFYGIAQDITERKQADEALRASEERYRALCELISDYAYSFRVNLDGSFEDEWVTGDSFVRLTGYHWSELDDVTLFHPDEIAMVAMEQEMLRQGKPVARDYRIITKWGEERWLHIARRPLWDEQQQRVIRFYGIAQDITERKHAEAAEHEQRMLAEALRDAASALTTTTDFGTTMNRILETVGRVVPHDHATVTLIEGNVARVAFAHSGSAVDEQVVLTSPSLPLLTPTLRRMIETRLPIVVADTSKFPSWLEVDAQIPWQVRSYVAVPIQVRGQVVGFLNLHSSTPDYFTPLHAERIRVFADQAALAIENAQLYDELQDHARVLEERVVERTDALQRAKEHVEAILDSSSDALIVARQDGTISQANPAFSQLFGFTSDEVLGRSLLMLVETSRVDELSQALQAVTDTGQSRWIEMVVRRKDGSMFDADLALSPILEQAIGSSTVSTSGLIFSVHDISEHKQAEIAIRQALEAEIELGELKSRFVSMASHEFRTPLATILSSVELLQRYRERMDEARITQKLDTIVDQVHYLTSVIEAVLDLSRMQSGQAVINPVELDLDRLCQEILDDFAHDPAVMRQLHYSADKSPLLATLDKRLIHQIINNLVSNAIKYSPPQKPITIHLEHAVGSVILSVRDQGIGIPAAELKHLFEPFHRATNVGVIAGTGLGLSITKQAVELQGGSIAVVSEVDAGTTVTVVLPLKPQPQAVG